MNPELPPTPQPQTQPNVPPAPPPGPAIPPPTPLPAPKKHMPLPLLLITILVLAVLGGTAYYLTKKTSVNTPAVTSSELSHTSTPTNNWTGKGSDLNWSDANNWSLGKPVNGQTLEIDMANVKPVVNQGGGNIPQFQDDIANLKINKLIITGQSDNPAPDIQGQELAITDGIELNVTRKTTTDNTEQFIQIGNIIDLVGNQTVEISAKNNLTFYSKSGTALNLGTSTIQFKTAGNSSIDIDGAIAGTGTINLPDNIIDPNSGISFERSSPDFKGKVIIGSGDEIGVGDADSSGGYGAVDGLGSSSIQIKAGGVMSVFAAGTDTFTINNDVALAGNGILPPGSGAKYSGAINTCVTTAQEGCSAGITVTLTGKITLTGDTELGASYGDEAAQTPPGTVATYVINNLAAGSYSLSAVPNSMVVIQQ